MRVVLDTNILVSALITKGTPPVKLYQAWLRNQIELETHDVQIDEVSDVLARARFRSYIDSDEAARMGTAIFRYTNVLNQIPVTLTASRSLGYSSSTRWNIAEHTLPISV